MTTTLPKLSPYDAMLAKLCELHSVDGFAMLHALIHRRNNPATIQMEKALIALVDQPMGMRAKAKEAAKIGATFNVPNVTAQDARWFSNQEIAHATLPDGTTASLLIEDLRSYHAATSDDTRARVMRCMLAIATSMFMPGHPTPYAVPYATAIIENLFIEVLKNGAAIKATTQSLEYSAYAAAREQVGL